MIRKTTVFLSWTTLILWLLVIFSLSSQPGPKSNDISKSVTKQIVKSNRKGDCSEYCYQAEKNIMNKLNNLFRKYAHVEVYLVLGMLVMNAFAVSGIRGCKTFAFSLIFYFFYATTDEIHQLFVPGRGAKATDVLIDSIGALIGIGLYKFIFKIYYTIKTRPSPKQL